MKKPYNKYISKQHKIRNVDKQVCTAEQMLAYNFAFSMGDTIKRWYNRCTTGIQRSEVTQEFTMMCMKQFENSRYNLDAIVHIFRNNIENYVKSGCKIYINYKEIGEMFPCGYEIR